MQERFSKTKDPQTVHHLAWTCVIGPEATADFLPILELAEKNAARYPNNTHYAICLGAARYRAGQFEEAIHQLEKAINSGAKDGYEPFTRLFLAMAHHRLGHAEAANQSLAKATQWLGHQITHDSRLDGGTWVRRRSCIRRPSAWWHSTANCRRS